MIQIVKLLKFQNFLFFSYPAVEMSWIEYKSVVIE